MNCWQYLSVWSITAAAPGVTRSVHDYSTDWNAWWQMVGNLAIVAERSDGGAA